MDLESKDLLELVRGRDRTEFQHLKSEIYRFVVQSNFNKFISPITLRARNYSVTLIYCVILSAE